MRKFVALFLGIFFIVITLYSCKESDVLPIVPEPVNPGQKEDTVPVIPDPEPIEFPFGVTATIDEFVSWQENDSLVAKVKNASDEQTIVLHIDSISEDKNTAMFKTVLDFEPDEGTEWLFSRFPANNDLSQQDGTLNGLAKYVGLSAKSKGLNSEILMKRNIIVVKALLPVGAKTLYCQNGFSATVSLADALTENVTAYIAIPDTCVSPINISVLNSNGDVFRSRYIPSLTEIVDENNTSEISLVNHSTIVTVVKTPYKTIMRGNFSGITWMNDSYYAVADDNGTEEGWHIFNIPITDECQILDATQESFVSSYLPNRDIEGIAYNPTTDRMWLVGENDNIIAEHTLDGERTGTCLNTSMFTVTEANCGIEALSYNPIAKRYWTTTEVGMAKDGGMAAPNSLLKKNTLRLQSYLSDGTVGAQWLYETDDLTRNTVIHAYSFGVPTICALDDGRLLVLEREVLIKLQVGDIVYSRIKIFLVDPMSTQEGKILKKQKLVDLENKVVLSLSPVNFAGDYYNFEGMCLGPHLKDGSQLLMLVSDSQGGMTLSQDDKTYVFPDTFLPIKLDFQQ